MIKYNKDEVKTVLLNVCLICGLIILTAGILDWFNPFMNFSGQIRPIEIVQTGVLVFLVLSDTPVPAQGHGRSSGGRVKRVSDRPQ